jgi:hypothetical protein
MFSTLSTILGSAVATSGTFAVAYPSGTARGDFVDGVEHKMLVNQRLYTSPADFTVAFGASTATITWKGTNTLAAGSTVRLQFDQPGSEGPAGVLNAVNATVLYVDLGNPATADDDGVSAVQLLGSAGNFTIGGALATGGVATFDVPRNVILTVATTDHSARTFTVYGTDAYGDAVVEAITGPNAGVSAGKKAFKTVTRVACDGAIATNGVKVGTGDVLGLPVRVPHSGCVLSEFQDGAKATAGTTVGGLSPLTASTATTADVRGTYDPNAACDGTKAFGLIVAVMDPTFLGVPQYTV